MVDELKTAGDVSPANTNDGVHKEAVLREVAFNDAQQQKVQSLIDDAYKRAYTKALRGATDSDEMRRLRSEVESLKSERKNSTLLKAVARHNVVDPEEVAELLTGKVKYDDHGSVYAESNGKKVSVDEFVGDWLTDRPHHLRSSPHQGGGSASARKHLTGRNSSYNLSDPETWRNMPREDFDSFMKEGVVIGGGSKTLSFKNVSNPFHEARKKKFKK